MGKKEIRYRLLHTISEAMYLLHISDRRTFLKTYIDTGILGVFCEEGTGRIMIPRVDIEAAISKRLYYRGLDESQAQRT